MNIKIIRNIALVVLCVTAIMLTGCLFKRGANPVGTDVIAQSQQMTPVANGEIRAASFEAPADRKFSFHKARHNVIRNFRQGISNGPGRIRFSLQGATESDNLVITFDSLKVKPKNGQKQTLSMESREINLMSATALSEVLAEAELEEGVYNYMEISVKEARLDGKLVHVPSRRIRFFGSFEIKEGFTTNLNIRFMHRLLRIGTKNFGFYIMLPIVRIGSELVPNTVDEEITDGEVRGLVNSFVDATPIAGVTVALAGTEFTTVTDENGLYDFGVLPAGLYNLSTSHPDYLDNSASLEVLAGQVAEVEVSINPAVIRSTVGNTGWFSEMYPLADAHGHYGEMSLETPIEIDFVSLAFVKAELSFSSYLHANGTGRVYGYLAGTQQVSADADMGTWWAGNSINSGTFIGEYLASTVGHHYVMDVTEIIRANPSNAYFKAAKNLSIQDIKLTDVQLTIYYR